MTPARYSQTLRSIPVRITMWFLSVPVEAQYSGGTGEPNDPYQIATAADLIALGETPEDYDKDFILTADIDLDPNLPGRKVFDRAVIAPDAEFDESTLTYHGTFTGSLDGQGHVIRNLTIRGLYVVGLFGAVASSGRVCNLGLEAVNVYGTEECVGGLVGFNLGSITTSYSSTSVNGNGGIGGLVGVNSYGTPVRLGDGYLYVSSEGVGYDFCGTIDSSHSTGWVNGNAAVGGVVGANGGGHIPDSHSSATVTGGDYVGGLMGQDTSGNISSSYSTGTVSGDDYVGGLVGQTEGGTIVWSYSTGTVSGTDEVGGLVGGNVSGLITTSYSTGTVNGRDNVGGLVGGTNGSCRIVSSYSRGAVDGISDVGGLVGKNAGVSSIYSSYSSGAVTGTSDVGGLVGRHYVWDPNDDEDRINSSFWDMETSGQTASDRGIGKTTPEMTDIQTFVDAGWDFETVWTMTPGQYPHLERRGPEGPDSNGWVRLSPMKMARDQFAGALIGDEIFVFGGNAMGGKNLYSGEKYNIAADTWSDIADNQHEPWGVEEVSGIGFDGKFYVFGASGGHNYNEMYDPVTNTWTTLAKKPTRTAAAIPILYEGEMFFFGGYTGNLTASGTVEAYDPDQDTWREVKYMPRALSSHAVAFHDHSAYIIGGYDEDAGVMNDEVMRYDFRTNEWERGYHTAPPDAARIYPYATQTLVVNGKVYLIGGIEAESRVKGRSVDRFTIFDIEAKEWNSGPALPKPRQNHLTVISDNTIYVIGGKDHIKEGEIDFENTKDTVFALRLPAVPDINAAVGVHRLWSGAYGRHLYTIDESEKEDFLQDSAGAWQDEGVVYRAFAGADEPNIVPVYRFFSANLNSHFYTISESEKDFLIDAYADVWEYEKIAFYAFPQGQQPADASPVYRFWSDVPRLPFLHDRRKRNGQVDQRIL
ncbi:MAG: hypothetical protein JW993_12210 [Sedimentisphaerales bacterium]|nr:hypothetical protein [Sedimentisphaerales bacterium]